MQNQNEIEYATLSLSAGIFSGRVDRFLGRPHFASKVRKIAWQLTPAILEELRQEARDLGVPETVFAETDADRANAPGLVELGLELQKIVDQKSVQ